MTGTFVRCPQHQVDVDFGGGTIGTVTVFGNGVSLPVWCPFGHYFDGAPGGGTFTTGADGRLRKTVAFAREARQLLLSESREELVELLEQLQMPGAPVPEPLTMLQSFEAWAAAYPETWTLLRPVLIALVVALLGAAGLHVLADSEPPPPQPVTVVVAADPTEAEFEARVLEAIERLEAQPPAGSPERPGPTLRRRERRAAERGLAREERTRPPGP